MNDKIIGLLKNTVGRLVFALLCGAAYYIIVLKFIISHTSAGGGLLGFFFLPAIVCGMGLIIIKILRSEEEREDVKAMLRLFWAHIVLILISITFLLTMI